jgi:hypothetical protein
MYKTFFNLSFHISKVLLLVPIKRVLYPCKFSFFDFYPSKFIVSSYLTITSGKKKNYFRAEGKKVQVVNANMTPQPLVGVIRDGRMATSPFVRPISS